MHLNKTIGIIGIIIGIVLVILSYHTDRVISERMAEANYQGKAPSEFTSETVRSTTNERAIPYKDAVFWGYVGGCLIFIGGGILIFYNQETWK